MRAIRVAKDKYDVRAIADRYFKAQCARLGPITRNPVQQALAEARPRAKVVPDQKKETRRRSTRQRVNLTAEV